MRAEMVEPEDVTMARSKYPELADMEEGKAYPMAILIQAEIQSDFEPVLERRITTMNYEGVWQ